MEKPFRRIPLDVLAALSGFFFFALLLLSLKNPTSLDDGLRHFAMATVMRERGVIHLPDWGVFLSHGYLSTVHVDPWFLSDVILIPFTYLQMTLALHLFVICEVGLLLFAWVLLLRSVKLPEKVRALFVLLLLCGNLEFIGRFLFARPYALMTAMLLFVLWCIASRRWILGAAFIAVSVLLSQLFVFALFVCVAAAIGFLFVKDGRSTLNICAMAIAGFLAGLFLHPDAFTYVRYLLDAFIKIPFHNNIGLSPEMQTGIIDSSFVSIVIAWAWILLSFVTVWKARRSWKCITREPRIITLLIACISLSVFYIFWLRTVDVLWPLLLLLGAVVYRLDMSAAHLIQKLLLPKTETRTRRLVAILFVFCVLQIFTMPFTFTRDDARHNLERFSAIDALPADNRVLNFDWDLFFVFVARRPDLHYATGIDPTFTYLTDPDVTYQILALKRRTSPLSDAERIATVCAVLAAYPSDDIVLSRFSFEPVIGALQKDKNFELLGSSSDIVIFAAPKVCQ